MARIRIWDLRKPAEAAETASPATTESEDSDGLIPDARTSGFSRLYQPEGPPGSGKVKIFVHFDEDGTPQLVGGIEPSQHATIPPDEPAGSPAGPAGDNPVYEALLRDRRLRTYGFTVARGKSGDLPSPANPDALARAKGAEILSGLTEEDEPVHLVTHSAGGLLIAERLSEVFRTVPGDESSTATGPAAMPDGEPPIEKDDAYWREIERAVGRGAPSVLFGTSTRALDRSLRELKLAQQGIKPPGSSARHRKVTALVAGAVVLVLGLCSLLISGAHSPTEWTRAAGVVCMTFGFAGIVVILREAWKSRKTLRRQRIELNSLRKKADESQEDHDINLGGAESASKDPV